MDKNNLELSSFKLYGRLLSYVLPYIPLFLISILGFAIYSGSQVAATEWLKRVIDYVNDPEGDLRLLLPMSLIAIAFIRGIGFFIGNYFFDCCFVNVFNVFHFFSLNIFSKDQASGDVL